MNYPRCASSFKYFYNSTPELLDKFNNKLKNVKAFDVTLRDGLQGMSREEQMNIKSIDKINLYLYIKNKYSPPNMEIGSIVSNKIFPIFEDSSQLFNYIENFQTEDSSQENNYNFINNYILIPNENKFKEVNGFIGLNCFSFITSVSESFQMKNTKMTLNETFRQINRMTNLLNDNNKIKVYVSCINECPIEGKIPILNIVSELFALSTLKIDKICLSDTCGTLTNLEFIDIIENTKKLGINTKKFTLHLHINPENEDEAEKIFHSAINYGIEEFDVSSLKYGGCSVTIDKNKLASNMSYEQYYKFLTTYLLNN